MRDDVDEQKQFGKSWDCFDCSAKIFSEKRTKVSVNIDYESTTNHAKSNTKKNIFPRIILRVMFLLCEETLIACEV
jgi:hypothetical protein